MNQALIVVTDDVKHKSNGSKIQAFDDYLPYLLWLRAPSLIARYFKICNSLKSHIYKDVPTSNITLSGATCTYIYNIMMLD